MEMDILTLKGFKNELGRDTVTLMVFSTGKGHCYNEGIFKCDGKGYCCTQGILNWNGKRHCHAEEFWCDMEMDILTLKGFKNEMRRDTVTQKVFSTEKGHCYNEGVFKWDGRALSYIDRVFKWG